MYRPYFIFLLLHNEVPISEEIREKTMYFHIYLHNSSKVHNFEIFLEYQGTIDDNKFISNNNNEPVIVPYNSEYELDEPIIYQEKYDGE